MKKEKIEIIILKWINLLAYQCEFLEMVPSEFINVLDKIFLEVKSNLISDEKYEKLREEEKNEN